MQARIGLPVVYNNDANAASLYAHYAYFGSDAVQRSYSQYGDLAAMREPLKYSFRLTLTLVLWLAMLAAILAIFSAVGCCARWISPVRPLRCARAAAASSPWRSRR